MDQLKIKAGASLPVSAGSPQAFYPDPDDTSIVYHVFPPSFRLDTDVDRLSLDWQMQMPKQDHLNAIAIKAINEIVEEDQRPEALDVMDGYQRILDNPNLIKELGEEAVASIETAARDIFRDLTPHCEPLREATKMRLYSAAMIHLIKAQVYLAGWDGVDFEFETEFDPISRRDRVKEDLIARLPQGHVARISAFIETLRKPSEEQEKNSNSPSPSPNDPKNTPVDDTQATADPGCPSETPETTPTTSQRTQDSK